MPKPRPSDKKTPRAKMYIYCEGEKTEPQYIKGYLHAFADRALRSVVEVPPTRKNTPAQLVDQAVDHKKSRKALPGDVFWVVYDREAVNKYSEALHARAYTKANDNGVFVAFSNVCFESWLLLHLEERCAPYASCDDLLARSPLKRLLKERFGIDYNKGDRNIFSKIKDSVPVARGNAVRVNASAMASSDKENPKPYHLNPYTDVHLLLDAIDNFEH